MNNLYISSIADIDFNGQRVVLKQTTNYPWEGNVKFEIVDLQSNKFDLKIRIPGWANNKPVPSDLYSYTSVH